MDGFKDWFIWFKEWYCCFGKHPEKCAYQFNIPKEAAWLTLQAGQESVVSLCSWAPLTATVTVQGSLKLLLPCKTRVQGLGRNSKYWAEPDCAAPRIPMPRVGGPGMTTWLRYSRIYSVLTAHAVTISPLSLVIKNNICIDCRQWLKSHFKNVP